MIEVAVVGAGPQGLAAVAHLRRAGVEAILVGDVMGFWHHHMPAGMLLRSYWPALHISDPTGSLTLDAYQAHTREVPRPVPLDRFVDYGRWFADRVAPDLDTRRVDGIARVGGHFRLLMSDGASIECRRVALAAGMGAFARRPPEFDRLPLELASHTSDHDSFRGFAGQRVVVLGGGQSSLESAALLREAGADVEVIARSPSIRWLRFGTGSKLHSASHSRWNPLRSVMYPPSNIGPPGINFLVHHPPLLKSVPSRDLQAKIGRYSVRPGASGWLQPRLAGVPIKTGIRIEFAEPDDGRLQIRSSDGITTSADHLLLATGYAVDIGRYPFITPDLLRDITTIDGSPRLSDGFESSIPGLHFLGGPAMATFGPLVGHVSGSGFSARSLTRAITRGGRERSRPRATAA